MANRFQTQQRRRSEGTVSSLPSGALIGGLGLDRGGERRRRRRGRVGLGRSGSPSRAPRSVPRRVAEPPRARALVIAETNSVQWQRKRQSSSAQTNHLSDSDSLCCGCCSVFQTSEPLFQGIMGKRNIIK